MMAEGARNPKVATMIDDFDRRIRDRLHEAISHGCVDQTGGAQLPMQEIEARMSIIGLLIDGLQVRTFLEGEALPGGVMSHVRALLAQTLSPAPIVTGAA